ncbi:MAG: flagellar brake protein [Oxalobacteraceae bacterium]|nr:flagellar brake protein [Oxalobacteraceae bacterium]
MKIIDHGSENELPNLYAITSPREIAALLRSVEEKRQLIRMLAHDGAEAIVTSILEVNNDSVIIDCALDSNLNQRIIDADKVSFETTLDKIRILFSVTQVTSCIKDDRPALRIAVPTSLIRLQRREFYRINTSITSPVHCIIPLQNGAGEKVVKAVLHDISCGGISISDDSKVLDDTIGRIYKDCKITLPGIGTITTSLVVANSQEQTLLNNKKRRRIGCASIDLPNSMLNMVQRYIGKLERELNAKLNWLE